MIRVKGPIVKSVLKFIKGHLGDEEYDSLMASLPEDIRDFFGKPILTSAFYDSDKVIVTVEAFIRKTGLDPEKTYHEMGRISADEGLKGIYKIFLKVGTPAMMLRQAPLIFRSYYSDGKMVTEQPEKNQAIVRITDAGINNTFLCTRITGYIERAMELSGGKEVRLLHTHCFDRGDDREEWKGLWA